MVKRSRSDATSMVRRIKPRRLAIARLPKKSFNGYCEFTRSCTISLATTAAAGWTIGASSFAALCAVFSPTEVSLYGSAVGFLSQGLPNAAEIAALWDSVEIYKVEVTMDHYNDPSQGGNSTAMPRVAICNDYNDGSAGTTVDAILQHSDCKYTSSRSNKWTVYPKHQRVIYYNAVTSSYEPARGFVTAGVGIPHYGVHFGITEVATIAAGRTTWNFKTFFRAKNTK